MDPTKGAPSRRAAQPPPRNPNLEWSVVHKQWLLRDEIVEGMLKQWGLDPANLEATDRTGHTAFHWSCRQGRSDMCRWLKAKGPTDLINRPDNDGRTPLMWLIFGGSSERMATWLMNHGADIAAMDNWEGTIFNLACRAMSFRFIRRLAEKVPPEHLAMPSKYDNTPMGIANLCNVENRVEIVKLLVLRGAPVRPKDFAERRPCAELLAWADDELALHQTYMSIVLGGVVHGNRDVAPAQRSQLRKLRGDGNVGARMRIAKCLGVRVGPELGRIRRAALAWRTITEGGEKRGEVASEEEEDSEGGDSDA